MENWEHVIIPPDDAAELLNALGIDPNTPQVQRWRQDDGFRWVDLDELLSGSLAVLTVDWRDWPGYSIEEIDQQLRPLGIWLNIQHDASGEQGTIFHAGQKKSIKYIPNDGDEFDTVIASINELIRDKARYRKFRSSEGSDTACYALLSLKDWERLESDAKSMVELLFV